MNGLVPEKQKIEKTVTHLSVRPIDMVNEA